jgi:hypothetical protein
LSDLKSRWAQDAWTSLLESRRRRNRKRRILGAIAGGGALGLLVLAVLQRDAIPRAAPLTVREIVLTGNRVVEGAEVLDLLGLRAGDPWWRYAPSDIRNRVERHPRVASLHLRYEWFHRLHVEVEERVKSLYVLGGLEGDVTTDGWFLPSEPVGESGDHPVLRAAPGTLPMYGRKVDGRTSAVARLFGQLEQERPDLWREVSEIELTAREARAYLRSPRGVILFEPGENDDLWLRVPDVLADLVRRGRDDIVLDLTFPGRIVVRLPDTAVPDTLTSTTGREEA